ncbi:MAG: phosphoribosyltransferase [Candidatus Gribaldobacteria bacterium]|nr:phosphoribosyltransferase [Candidatus Gribaldobacteria bacterium]
MFLYKGWIDGSGYLYRKYSLPKNTRDDITQYESLAIKNINFLQGKNVLLLDDVTTSGSSFVAGLKILALANPKKLKALAIAKKAYLKDVPLSGIY